MKRLFLLCTILMLFYACKQKNEDKIIGTWLLNDEKLEKYLEKRHYKIDDSLKTILYFSKTYSKYTVQFELGGNYEQRIESKLGTAVTRGEWFFTDDDKKLIIKEKVRKIFVYGPVGKDMPTKDMAIELWELSDTLLIYKGDKINVPALFTKIQ